MLRDFTSDTLGLALASSTCILALKTTPVIESVSCVSQLFIASPHVYFLELRSRRRHSCGRAGFQVPTGSCHPGGAALHRVARAG